MSDYLDALLVRSRAARARSVELRSQLQQQGTLSEDRTAADMTRVDARALLREARELGAARRALQHAQRRLIEGAARPPASALPDSSNDC